MLSALQVIALGRRNELSVVRLQEIVVCTTEKFNACGVVHRRQITWFYPWLSF
jgi:hypothetical protein